MPLNFRCGEIDNWKEVCVVGKEGRERWSVEIEALTHACLAIGMSEISKRNDKKFEQFVQRLQLWEKVCGAFRFEWKGGEERPRDKPFTREELERFRGLTTNVSHEPKREYLRRLTRNWPAI